MRTGRQIRFLVFVFYLLLVLAGAPALAAQNVSGERLDDLLEREKVEQTVQNVAGASVYKLPLIGKINVRNMKLFPHYKPKRVAAGWTHAYIEFATPSETRVWVEEIPPRSFKLIGRRDKAQYTFIGVSGKGYTEFRDDVNKPGKGVVWTPGDEFFIPFGSWYGHANPFDEPARILIFVDSLDERDIMNPFLGRTRSVPELTFPGERRAPIPEDDVIENVDWKAAALVEQKTIAPDFERRGPAKTLVFRSGTGGTLNLVRAEMPSHHKKIRAGDGWKGIHMDAAPELGYRSGHSNLQEMPPRSREIGHKHSGNVWFLGVKGRGYMALRASADAPESRINWVQWDLWLMPWLTAGGTWHSHGNPYDEPARISAVAGVDWDDNGLLNGFIDSVRHQAADGVGFGAPDQVFREKEDVLKEKQEAPPPDR